MEECIGRDITESVRQRALSGMCAGRARPEDFELFLARIDSQPGQLQRMIVRAMFVADAARAEETCLGWIAAGWLSISRC